MGLVDQEWDRQRSDECSVPNVGPDLILLLCLGSLQGLCGRGQERIGTVQHGIDGGGHSGTIQVRGLGNHYLGDCEFCLSHLSRHWFECLETGSTSQEIRFQRCDCLGMDLYGVLTLQSFVLVLCFFKGLELALNRIHALV